MNETHLDESFAHGPGRRWREGHATKRVQRVRAGQRPCPGGQGRGGVPPGRGAHASAAAPAASSRVHHHSSARSCSGRRHFACAAARPRRLFTQRHENHVVPQSCGSGAALHGSRGAGLKLQRGTRRARPAGRLPPSLPVHAARRVVFPRHAIDTSSHSLYRLIRCLNPRSASPPTPPGENITDVSVSNMATSIRHVGKLNPLSLLLNPSQNCAI